MININSIRLVRPIMHANIMRPYLLNREFIADTNYFVLLFRKFRFLSLMVFVNGDLCILFLIFCLLFSYIVSWLVSWPTK